MCEKRCKDTDPLPTMQMFFLFSQNKMMESNWIKPVSPNRRKLFKPKYVRMFIIVKRARPGFAAGWSTFNLSIFSLFY